MPELHSMPGLWRAIIRLKGIVTNSSQCSWDEHTPGTDPGERRI